MGGVGGGNIHLGNNDRRGSLDRRVVGRSTDNMYTGSDESNDITDESTPDSDSDREQMIFNQSYAVDNQHTGSNNTMGYGEVGRVYTIDSDRSNSDNNVATALVAVDTNK